MRARSLPAFLFLSVALFFVCCFLSAGCKSTPSVDWNNRIGNYTYDEAVAELGSPQTMERLANGQFEAQWIKFTNTGFGFGVGMGYSGNNGGVGMGQTVGAGYNSKVLTLVFGPDKKLISWSKNY